MPIRPKKNPITKIIGAGVKAAVKAAGKNVKPSLKAARKAKPLANPKSAVRVKLPAKTKASPVNKTKVLSKNSSSQNRASDRVYKKIEAETRKYKVSERTGYEHRYASDAAERAGNSAKLSPKIARKAAASNPVAKKALKKEKRLDKKHWEDMFNSRNG